MSTQPSAIRHLLLTTGPPFGAPMWSGVSKRLQQEHDLHSDLLALNEAPDLATAAAQIEDRVRDADAPVALVAHGTAIPAALLAAQQTPPAALVLSNGPLLHPSVATRALGALPAPLLSNVVLRPKLWLRYLSSSLGLRRMVINPYVMDHDTVVAVCHQAVVTPQRRTHTASFLRDVASSPDWPSTFSGPTLLIWGDQDPLYPVALIDDLRVKIPHLTASPIPGGQHLHPIERPWAMADAIAQWLPTATP